MSIGSAPYYPEGFFVGEGQLEAVQSKIGTIATDGAGLLEARLDFDRTLTTNGAKDLTSWDIISGLLSKKGQEEDRRLYDIYQPLEFNNKLEPAQAERWWGQTLQLYANERVKIDGIEKAAKSVELRPGVRNFFNICQENNVYTTILSAGIKNVISIVADRYRIKPDLILSTELKVDQKTQEITGWEQENVIHILNKGEMGSPRLREVRSQRPNTLVIGDAIEDVRMADDHEDGEVLRIRVGDPHKLSSKNVSVYLDESFENGFDMVCLGGFQPINKLAAFIITASNSRKS